MRWRHTKNGAVRSAPECPGADWEPAVVDPPAPDVPAPTRDELIERAEALGIQYSARWGTARLAAAVDEVADGEQ